MAPLVVMLVAWLVARLAGFAGLGYQADSWSGAPIPATGGRISFT